MRRRAEKRVVVQGGVSGGGAVGVGRLLRPLLEGIEASRRALLEFFYEAGVVALSQQLSVEVEAIAGPKGRHSEGREAYRWGSVGSEFVLGGRKIVCGRPRVRGRQGGELVLPSVKVFQDEDPFTERVIEQALLGVSQRGYARSLEPIQHAVPTRATSKSAVQRRLVMATRKLMGEWLARDLSDFHPLILMLDGIEVGGYTLVVALGIAADGTKRVLGVRQGATENAAVCSGLLQDLLDRGLALPAHFLVVLDGGKGARKAVRSVFGEATPVQRCQVHKRRNVRDHLPKQLQARVDRLLVEAYRSANDKLARRRLDQLAGWLERDGHTGAAASVREGLDEMLTVLRLGLAETLQRFLTSTNAIENTLGAVRRITRNVKHWRRGDMALRWSALALREAEHRFRRIRGHRHLGDLAIKLAALVDSRHTEAAA